jgi:hypothetical protein
MHDDALMASGPSRSTAFSTSVTRERRDADATSVRLTDPGSEVDFAGSLGRGFASRTSGREDSGLDNARFIAHGLLDPNEESSHFSSMSAENL